MKHTNPDRYFISSKSAKHRVAKVISAKTTLHKMEHMPQREKVMEKLLIQTSILEAMAVVDEVETVTQIWGTQRLYNDVV